MKKLILSLVTLLLISCGSEWYAYSDSISIASTIESQRSDLKRVSEIVQKINREEFRVKLLAKFPDALTDYIEKIHLQAKSVKKSVSVSSPLNKTTMSKVGVIIMIEMNYDNSRENQANEIVSYYKELITAELNKNGIIATN